MKDLDEINTLLRALDAILPYVVIIFIVLIVWVAIRVLAAISYAFHADGGISRREQLHRHRTENLCLVVAISAFIIGVVCEFVGASESRSTVAFPGGVRLENAGIPIILIGFASSVLWMVLKKGLEADNERDEDIPPVDRAPMSRQIALQDSRSAAAPTIVTTLDAGQPVSVTGAPSSLDNITYTHASVISLCFLPFMSGFFWILLPATIYLFWRATKNRARAKGM